MIENSNHRGALSETDGKGENIMTTDQGDENDCHEVFRNLSIFSHPKFTFLTLTFALASGVLIEHDKVDKRLEIWKRFAWTAKPTEVVEKNPTRVEKSHDQVFCSLVYAYINLKLCMLTFVDHIEPFLVCGGSHFISIA